MVATVDTTHAWAQFPGGGLPRPGGSALSGSPNSAAAGLHRIHSADSLPGEVGGARLQRWGAVAGYYQPVAFRGPGSTAFSLGVDGVFQPPMPSQTPLHAGLLVGGVYRFRVTAIPGFEGEEIFPTIEVIDRTYPPHHLAVRHPIPIHLELDDLRDALSGRMVTRVIYLEDPTSAVPIDTTPESGITLDIPPYQDPLHVADTLGKPVAIIRIGSVTPPTHQSLLPQFFFGYPPWVRIDSPVQDVPFDDGLSEQTQPDFPAAP
ncbi:MAG TPA: hypothetical protein DDZ51_16395 [Planctomycetaceae bacterium]|nr:hypothetical protein [Planctomycetaceae bacterium]